MTILIFIIVVLISSVIQGITGFGYAVIASPIIITLISKENMVVSMTLISLVLNSFLAVRNHEKIHFKILLPLLIGGFLGIPFGVIVLKFVSVNTLKIAIGLLSVIFAVILLNEKAKIPAGKFMALAIGWLAGLLQSSINMNGPPVVLYLIQQKLKRDEMRKLLAVFFLCLSLATVIALFSQNIINPSNLRLGLFALPAVIIGVWFGNYLSGRVNKNIFRFLTLLLVIVGGLYAVLSSI